MAIVKTNAFRCLEHCPNCPFLDDGKAMHLEPGRVDAIKEKLLSSTDENFICHKTAYSLDNDMEPTQKQERKMCYGAYLFLKKKKRPNAIMQIAERLGLDHD